MSLLDRFRTVQPKHSFNSAAEDAVRSFYSRYGSNIPGSDINRYENLNLSQAEDHHLIETLRTIIFDLISQIPLEILPEEDAPQGAIPPQQEFEYVKELLDVAGPELIGALSADLKIFQNCFAVKQKNELGVIEEIKYVSPTRITPLITGGPGRMEITGYRLHHSATYTSGVDRPSIGTPRENNPYEYLPEDVIHIKQDPDPAYSGLIGRVKLIKAIPMLTLDTFLTDYTKKLIAKASTAGGVLTYKGDYASSELDIDEATLAGLEKKMHSITDGATVPIPENWEYQQLDQAIRYPDFQSLSDKPQADLASLYGMLATVIGWKVGLENSPYSKLETARDMEVEKIVLSLTSSIARGLYWQLGPDVFTTGGYKFEFDISTVGALQPDLNELSTRLRAEYEMNLISFDEFREKMGYEPAVQETRQEEGRIENADE